MQDAATRAEPGNELPFHGILIALAVLLLLPLPSQAATIVVDEVNCSLVDAVIATNTDSPSGGCPAGNDADTIVLTVDVTLTELYSESNGGQGLPPLVSDITLLGGQHTISRADDAPPFRCLVAGDSGHIHLQDVTLRNFSVAHGNFDGGAIYHIGNLYLTRVTVSGNEARNGGGISAGGARLGDLPHRSLVNTIVAANGTAGNCDNPGLCGSGDFRNNFDDDGTCGSGCGLLTGFDPNLADNGGPTWTHALLPGSSAIDAAWDYCSLEQDQRGAPRDDACDSGSYEFQCSIEVTLDVTGTAIAYTPAASTFDLVTGYLSDLLTDGDFFAATCVGIGLASPGVDPSPEPDLGDGRYYLARGVTSCVGAGYGTSSLIPDRRDALDAGPCP